MILESPLCWALEPESEILMFMWSFGPANFGFPVKVSWVCFKGSELRVLRGLICVFRLFSWFLDGVLLHVGVQGSLFTARKQGRSLGP